MCGSNNGVFSPMREEYPHQFVFDLAQYERMDEYIAWCVHQLGPADYAMSYDRQLHRLVMNPTGHNSGWFPMGASAVAFRDASALVLFKLTFV